MFSHFWVGGEGGLHLSDLNIRLNCFHKTQPRHTEGKKGDNFVHKKNNKTILNILYILCYCWENIPQIIKVCC